MTEETFSPDTTLYYNAPAKEWSEALPIGNGRLGAMVYGRTDTELLQLNENSVWYGGLQDRTPRDALKNLPRLRTLIRANQHAEAEKLVRRAFFATPHSQRHYEPLGTLTLEFDHEEKDVKNYSRVLNLETAITSVEYDHDGIHYSRSIFASQPDNVLVIQLESSEKTEVTIRLTRVSEREYETNEFVDSILAKNVSHNGRVEMQATAGGGKPANSVSCVVQTRCEDDGVVEAIGNCLVVQSQKVTIVISAQTTFRSDDYHDTAMTDVESALARRDLRERHIENYGSLFGRLRLHISTSKDERPGQQRTITVTDPISANDLKAPNSQPLENSKKRKQSTNERLLLASGPPDPSLIVLYHNFGRYLLLSCSRPGLKSLPATLQGLWNPSFQPAWGSKYTININTQMNYWPANLCNLAECEEPLFDHLERMAERGKMTAKVMYGCRGWAAHHNTDIWADTDPQDRWMPATLWPLGGAWLCCHIWECYLFNGSEEFLRKMFPLLRGCVEFLVDYLIEDSSGKYLITNPSLSPENTFLTEAGTKGVLCEGSTIDIQIIDVIFRDFIDSASELGMSDSLLDEVKKSRERLPPMKIGSFGQLQEWKHDYAEYEPGHRHTSHLWGLYPGNSITPKETPNLAAACEVVLRRRADNGGGHTGWSRAWLINLHARL
jgi:hypothetical protein